MELERFGTNLEGSGKASEVTYRSYKPILW